MNHIKLSSSPPSLYNSPEEHIMEHNRTTALLFGHQLAHQLAQTHVLVVGAGGIGCEVLKNLCSTGFKQITVVDFDSIEQTNLNRQFYFRKTHIGLPKASTLSLALSALHPSLSLTAICDDIRRQIYNDRFYSQFSIIISALDSTKVREHLAAQATRNNKPFVDAGTMSYHGQTYASVRFRTSCHNCNPAQGEQEFAVCTIRSRPERPVHCATYAKNFYQSFFGGDLSSSLNDELKFTKYVSKQPQEYSEKDLTAISIAVFTELFDRGIRDIDLQGNKIDIIHKLPYSTAILSQQPVSNPPSTFNQEQHQKQQKSNYREQTLWSIKTYTEQFVLSFLSLLHRKFQNSLPPKFQKDDEDCMTLVLCITNLRTHNFLHPHSPHNRHKYLTYYQCKDMIGKVFPAIASTNAIAAALQLREVMNLLTHRLDKLRYVTITNTGDERLQPAHQSSPNLDCDYCSEKVVYAKAACNMGRVLFKELEQFARENLFSANRDVASGSHVIVRNSRKTASHSNKQKPLNFVTDLVHNGVLNLSFLAQSEDTPWHINLAVFHREQAQGLQLFDTPSKSELKKQLMRYLRKKRGSQVQNYAFEMQMFGGHQV